MTSSPAPLPRRRAFTARTVALVVTPCLAMTAGLGLVAAGPATAATTALDLGRAAPVAVLAGSTVTNTGPSILTGDLDVSPGSAITGFPPGIVVGTTQAANAAAAGAQADATAAFVSASSRTAERNLPVDPSGSVLTPGVYDGGTLNLTGTVTLDGGGDPAAVFLIRLTSTLDTAAGSRVSLIGGAQSCNVFFQVGSSATLGAGSTLAGTILALTSISTGDGATVDGRLLARNGAVTLIDTDVTRPVCAAVTAPTTSATPSASASSPATPSPSASASTSPAASPSALPVGSPLPSPEPTVVPVPGGGITGGGITGGGVPQLPRTGSDTEDLAVIGLLAVVVGGVLAASGHGPRYVPRHAAARRGRRGPVLAGS